MNFMNLGIGEILFIIVIALIIFGPGNMVKTAREAGAFLRKIAKSPYWQEIWATKRELSELPKMIAKEAQLDETIHELEKETRGLKSNLTSSVSDFMKEVNQPLTPNKISQPQKEPVIKPPDDVVEKTKSSDQTVEASEKETGEEDKKEA